MIDHKPERIHTFPVPIRFTAWEAWKCVKAGVRMIGTSAKDEAEGRIGYANMAVYADGREVILPLEDDE